MTAATPAEQRQLLELQHIDTAIRQLEHRRANLPEQRALDENTDALERTALEHSSAKDELDGLQRRQIRHEQEIAQIDSRRKSEEGRMYSGLITSDRELEALRNELGSLRNRKNDVEDALLEVMERVEELTSLAETLEARHAELTAEVSTLAGARDTAAVEIDGDLASRRASRRAVAADLGPDLLTTYDDLRPRKAGLAVAELRGRTCLGCNLDLTATEMEETRDVTTSRLARCPQCGRIVVLAA